MEPRTARIVVVGAGQAGAALVAKLRALGHAGPLTLVGAEPVPPYQRPPLSKAYLKGELARERLFLRPTSFYAAEGIELLTGDRASPPSTAPRARGRPRRRPAPRLRPPRAHHRRPAAPAARRRSAAALDGVLLMRNLADADALAARHRPGRAGAGRRRRLHRPRGGGGAAREGPRGHADRGGAAHPRPRRRPGHRRLLPRPAPRPRRRRSARARRSPG